MIVRHRSPFTTRGYPVVRAFDSSFDRTFEQLTQSFFEPFRRLPAVDSSSVDGSLVLSVDLPGVPSEAVNIEVAGRSLTIGVHTDELQWERTVQLGTSVDPEKVSARHVDGRLTVTVGAVDTPPTRTIAIDTGSSSPVPSAIESTTTEDATDEAAPSEGAADDDQSTATSSTG